VAWQFVAVLRIAQEGNPIRALYLRVTGGPHAQSDMPPSLTASTSRSRSKASWSLDQSIRVSSGIVSTTTGIRAANLASANQGSPRHGRLWVDFEGRAGAKHAVRIIPGMNASGLQSALPSDPGPST
jgi:hypothetical protein